MYIITGISGVANAWDFLRFGVLVARKDYGNFTIIALFVFAIAVLLVGQYSPYHSHFITCHVTSGNSADSPQKIEEILQTIDGVYPICLDKSVYLFTFRLDSGKTDIESVKSKMAGFGLQFNPMNTYQFLRRVANREALKFVSVSISSPSQQN